MVVSLPWLRRAKTDETCAGQLIGADGRTFDPSSDLEAIEPVQPPAGRTPEMPGETLFFINGILSPRESIFETLQQIAALTGQPTLGIHHATRGFFTDLLYCAKPRLGFCDLPVIRTAEHVISEGVFSGRGVHILASSEGAFCLKVALDRVRKQLTTARRADALLVFLKIETFGAAVQQWPDGPQYVHYINEADPVAHIVGMENRYTRTYPGRAARVMRFYDDRARGNPFKRFFVNHNFDTIYLQNRRPFTEALLSETPAA